MENTPENLFNTLQMGEKSAISTWKQDYKIENSPQMDANKRK
jgi:hypothetical protein